MRCNLRKIRKKKKMTHQAMADKLCIGRSYYTKIELGQRNPSLNLALRIKDVLDYSSDDIFKNIEQ